MPRRTNLQDAQKIEVASDVDEIVTDKREQWRANSAKARRRQRRYKKRMTDQLIHYSSIADGGDDFSADGYDDE
ncbi:hypothetical protein [Opacimonas viscosa]|uniref:Uncharacterized protein n=1 Tax=Opacimonas viscosa TaxID=2961944 RepID=A0AA41X326_9ALTE|nr:hypothetical protein [Opacimonas viscosa]MCP3429451.1 hypothetical protein [Opacimonas viscosa]